MTELNLKEITHRNDIGEFLNKAGLVGAAVEIGCAFGAFASTILHTWNGKALHLIDPWEKQSPEIYKENTEGINYEQQFRDCLKLAILDDRVHIQRKYSADASKSFEKETFDWIYIDGNHAFDSISTDLQSWYSLLKPGGVFSGHDFYLDTQFPHWCEVQPAVEKWAKENGYDSIHVTKCTSWWIQKRL